jgi:cellulose synthase operon protein C
MSRQRVLLLGLAALLLACGPRPGSTLATPPAPEVEYSGCWAVYLPGPICSLRPEPELNLWVKAGAVARVEIRAGGRRLDVGGVEAGDGRRFTLSLPPGLSPLTVRLCRADGPCGPPWSLALARPEVPAWFDELRRLQQSGAPPEEIRQRLERLLDTVPAREKGLVLRLLAYFTLGIDDTAAATYIERGITADRAEHCLSGEAEKVAWLARLHMDQGRFSDARRSLDALRLPPAAPFGAKYQVAYYQGLLADKVGDYRSALEQMRRAADLAERIGNLQYRWKAEQILARLLQDLGRSQDAARLFVRLREDPHPEGPCDMGELLTNVAWTRLLEREAGGEAGDPTPELREAQAIFENEKNRCRPESRLNGHLNLALAHQQAGRWRESREALEQARPLLSKANLRDRLWSLDLEAREAIAERRPERALRLYDELAEMAVASQSFEERFRAAFGRARARLVLGQRPAALAALAEADRRIDEQSRQVPVNEGRDTLVAQREVATRLYLDLLLQDGQRPLAFALARRARSRLLRQLAIRDRLAQLAPEERRRWDRALSRYWELRHAADREGAEDWKLPADQKRRARERRGLALAQAQKDLDGALADLDAPVSPRDREGALAPPGPGEVILIFHPLPRGWVGFAAHQEGVEVSRFDLSSPPPTDPEALSRLLLAPFRGALRHAERIRVLPYGPLRSVDFHTLPLDGEPLLARHLVIYSLDLPFRGAPSLPARPVALLVANPRSDLGYLPAAQEEAAAVAAAVGAWRSGWTLKRLDGPAASSAAVSEALPGAELFHFAGHGSFAGFAGWDSELPLADRSRLTLGDVLTLRRVPRWVVLSACDAGRSSQEAPGEGIGLAQAFLLAGSQAVIAATRPVADSATRDLLGDLYRSWQPGTDLALQLQRAELACRRRDPQADCASFRLLVP